MDDNDSVNHYKRSSDSDEELGPPNKQAKSGRSRQHSFVKFVNNTNRKVDVVWLNYEGAGIKYKTLDPQKSVDVNTFVGHPWTFRDSLTGSKMAVQMKEIYKPVAWEKDQGWPPQRKVVNITLPVYSLLERSLQVVQAMVPRSKISNLEIPQNLKDELLHLSRNCTPVRTLLSYQPSPRQRLLNNQAILQQQMLCHHYQQEHHHHGN